MEPGKIGQMQTVVTKLFSDARPCKERHIAARPRQETAYETANAAGASNDDPRIGGQGWRVPRHQPTALAAARPAIRPENRQPPRNVPSSAR